LALEIIVDYANSVLALPLVEGICPFQKFSGMGLEAESSLRIIDCPCQLKSTASVRAQPFRPGFTLGHRTCLKSDKCIEI
jgi:hypothetical protein